jgi:hypothetical protein
VHSFLILHYAEGDDGANASIAAMSACLGERLWFEQAMQPLHCV